MRDHHQYVLYPSKLEEAVTPLTVSPGVGQMFGVDHYVILDFCNIEVGYAENQESAEFAAELLTKAIDDGDMNLDYERVLEDLR